MTLITVFGFKALKKALWIVFILSSCSCSLLRLYTPGWLYTGKFESDKLIASLAVVIFNPGPFQILKTTRERELFITNKYYRESCWWQDFFFFVLFPASLNLPMISRNSSSLMPFPGSMMLIIFGIISS